MCVCVYSFYCGGRFWNRESERVCVYMYVLEREKVFVCEIEKCLCVRQSKCVCVCVIEKVCV
jgi:hypothetical protein